MRPPGRGDGVSSTIRNLGVVSSLFPGESVILTYQLIPKQAEQRAGRRRIGLAACMGPLRVPQSGCTLTLPINSSEPCSPPFGCVCSPGAFSFTFALRKSVGARGRV